MAMGPVHYELWVRRTAAAPWTLDCANEDRTLQLEAAQEMLKNARVAAIRVTKEVLDTETGGYASFKVFEAGAVNGPERRRVTEDAQPICAAPSDLYSAHSRERIAELLDGWLARRGVTAFELLHRPDLAEALEANGTDLQHAIQKIAVPEAQARGASTHAMMRAFQSLADRALERLSKDGRRKAFPTIEPSTYAGAATHLADHADGAYLLGGSVAARLADAMGWREKTARLLDLAEAAPSVGRARSLALAVIEAPLTEILGARGGLRELTRDEADGEDAPALDLGGQLSVLTRLATGRVLARLAVSEPGLTQILPPLRGEAARLGKLLDLDTFDNARAAIARRVLAELNGPRKLRADDPEGEIALLRALAIALTAAAGPLIQHEDVRHAFVERSKRLVAADFVESFMVGRNGPVDEARALVRLAENVTGAVNKIACGRWVAGVVESLRFEREVREGPDSPGARLLALAELHKSLRAVELPEAEVSRLLSTLGEHGGWVEAQAKVAAAIAKSAAPVPLRLQALLRMAAGETAPPGPAADRARTEALRLLRAPETRESLAAAPEVMKTLKTLLPAAGLAA